MSQARDAAFIQIAVNDEDEYDDLSDDEYPPIERGMQPHGRTHWLTRLGPPIVCASISLAVIIVAVVMFEAKSSLVSKLTNMTAQHKALVVAEVLLLVLATICLTLSCVSACLNYVPKESGSMQKYHIEKCLGEGEYGAVYKASTRSAKGAYTPVALKFLKMGSAEETNAGIQEAMNQCHLDHANVVNCREIFLYQKGTSFYRMAFHQESSYCLCMAMDLCDGDLSDWIKTWSKMPAWPDYGKVLNIFKEATSGVDFLHKQKLIHRDLKPENIFLSTDHQHVKVGDLGIALESEGQGIDVHSGLGIAGTPGYMAPELYKDLPFSTKADQWSLGCILFDMVRPTEDGGWSLANYVAESLESQGKSCQDLRENGDIWYPFGETGRMGEAISIAMQADPVKRNATVQEVLRRCLEPDGHRRISSADLLSYLTSSVKSERFQF